MEEQLLQDEPDEEMEKSQESINSEMASVVLQPGRDNMRVDFEEQSDITTEAASVVTSRTVTPLRPR